MTLSRLVLRRDEESPDSVEYRTE